VRALETNAALVAKLADLIPQPTEFFRLDIGGGVELDGWMMRPRDFDPSKGSRGLFHHALAEAGYVVACVDTQGTPEPRGKAWRKSTYQRFGPVGSDQQAAAVRALCKTRPYLDPERVAVWG